jgi:patatin-like phospholipase/acyl hydrolase
VPPGRGQSPRGRNGHPKGGSIVRRTVLLLVAVFVVGAFVTAPAFADSTRLCNNRCASDNDTTTNIDNSVEDNSTTNIDNSVDNSVEDNSTTNIDNSVEDNSTTNIDNSVTNNTTNNTTNNIENCTISGGNNNECNF